MRGLELLMWMVLIGGLLILAGFDWLQSRRDTDGEGPVFLHGDRLIHEGPVCVQWAANTGWVLEHEGTMLHLSDRDGVEFGDWDADETPNCPFCGENLYIETKEGVLMDPWDWWYPVGRPF
jgi:hypothetical protein